MNKKVLSIIGVVVIVIVVIVIGIGLFIGPIIKTAVEAVGPKILKASIKVEAVSVSALTGSASVKGLIVGNPEGFKTPHLVKLGSVSVGLDPFSVFSKKIVIRSMHIIAPEFTYEGGLGGNNISKTMDNINAATGAGKNGASSESEKGKTEQKIEIDDFLIKDAKVKVFISGLSSKEVTVPLPDIHLTNLGKESDGVTPAELIQTVFAKVSKSTVAAVTQTVTASGKILKDIGKDVGSKASESFKSITKDLKGLFQ